MTEKELFVEGMKSLDDALSCFDVMKSFAGSNLAGLVYIALRYGEEFDEGETFTVRTKVKE